MLSDGITRSSGAGRVLRVPEYSPGSKQAKSWLPGWVMRSNIVNCAHAITARRRLEKDFSW
jgi:hypothetical protein